MIPKQEKACQISEKIIRIYTSQCGADAGYLHYFCENWHNMVICFIQNLIAHCLALDQENLLLIRILNESSGDSSIEKFDRMFTNPVLEFNSGLKLSVYYILAVLEKQKFEFACGFQLSSRIVEHLSIPHFRV